MKRLLTLTMLAAMTGTSVGCNCCNCFSRREECPPYQVGNPCDPCAEGAMGAPAMNAPPTIITPGPAYSAGYMPN